MIYSNNKSVLGLALFCYNKLNLTKDIHIEVKPLEVHGYCYEDGLVELKEGLNTKDLGIALCHELVHCAQYEQSGHSNEEEAYNLEQKLYKEYKNEQIY
jgi:hypothetical protein